MFTDHSNIWSDSKIEPMSCGFAISIARQTGLRFMSYIFVYFICRNTKRKTKSEKQKRPSTKKIDHNKNLGSNRRFLEENNNLTLTSVKSIVTKTHESNPIGIYINNSHQILYNKTHYSKYFIPLYGSYDINSLWSNQTTAKMFDDSLKLPLSKNNEMSSKIYDSLGRFYDENNLKTAFNGSKYFHKLPISPDGTDSTLSQRFLEIVKFLTGINFNGTKSNKN